MQDGRHRTVRASLPCGLDVAIKSFGSQGRLKDRLALRRGSKALRTYRNAEHLASKGVGTPQPVAIVEHWEGPRLAQSYYVSLYADSVVSFRDHLIRLYRENPDCATFMSLLQHVAEAVASMHDAGFVHLDLGNQNILLQSEENEGWGRALFIDLNRGRCTESGASIKARARDISRITLPSDLRRVFIEMYWRGEVPPQEFLVAERSYRRRFAFHSLTRSWRHPVRERRIRMAPQGDDYPAPREMWVWDERSVQAVSTMVSRERHRYYPRTRAWFYLRGAIRRGLPALSRAKVLRRERFIEPGERSLNDVVSVAITARKDTFDRELELLHESGVRKVWLRLYHHESESRTAFGCDCVRALHDAGFSVSIALVQDRRAVLNPQEWETFCASILKRVEGQVEYVEYLHAINRVKWGLWGFEEARELFRVLARLQRRFPETKFTGPAVIDFEEEYLSAVFDVVPKDVRFSALSHLLYVDRRGAPENVQRGYDAVDKLALLQAFAETAPCCEPRVIVSEFNWPLKGTGVYSPVTSPYESPGERSNDPSVSEQDAACYTIRYLLLAIASGFVEMAVMWRLVARGFGLADDSDAAHWRMRPAFEALKILMSQLGAATFDSRLEIHTDEKDLYLMQFRPPAGPMTCVGWRNGDHRSVTLPFDCHSATGMLGEALSLENNRLQLGPEPVYLELQPSSSA